MPWNVITSLLKFATSIVDIVRKKGDGADNIRLKDIPGWKTLKNRINRHDRAVARFREKYKASRG